MLVSRYDSILTKLECVRLTMVGTRVTTGRCFVARLNSTLVCPRLPVFGTRVHNTGPMKTCKEIRSCVETQPPLYWPSPAASSRQRVVSARGLHLTLDGLRLPTQAGLALTRSEAAVWDRPVLVLFG